MPSTPRRDLLIELAKATLLGVLLFCAFITAVALLSAASGCQTYDAVTQAPEEFWVTAETIVAALLADLWSLVELLV